VEVSPLEMAEAYDTFANGGFRVQAYGIEKIRTASGQVLYEHGADPLSEMAGMLRQVIAAGTGERARIPGYDLAGKTGTTSDYRDAWFVGFTGGFVTAVWVGRDDDTPMKRVTGGAAPAEIWRSFMGPVLPRLLAQPIPGAAPADSPPDAIGDLLANQAPASPQPVPDEAPGPAKAGADAEPPF
jgi:penicillin-binding protein 1A